MAIRSELVLCLITWRLRDNSSQVSGFEEQNSSVTCAQALVSGTNHRLRDRADNQVSASTFSSSSLLAVGPIFIRIQKTRVTSRK